jgi:hypothetical protein
MAKMYYLADENYYEASALQIWKELEGKLNEKELQIIAE